MKTNNEKTSVYQLMCTINNHGEGLAKIKDDRLILEACDYASTRDLPCFEKLRCAKGSLILSIKVDFKFESACLEHLTDNHMCMDGMITWLDNGRRYVGLIFNEEALIVEIISERWIRIYCNTDYPILHDFVEAFRGDSNKDFRESVLNAVTLLNISIALDAVEVPGLCPAIF
ncbi:MAG: hypothetical protein V4560_02985 [Bacteroidota bacterium]